MTLNPPVSTQQQPQQPQTEHTKRIDQIYGDLLELDGKIKRCYSTFKTNIKELAYRYEMAITQDKLIDLPIGFIFDQIITKLKNQGFSQSSINYVYEIFEDEFMQKYKRKEYKPRADSKEKTVQDNNIKMIVTRMRDNLDQIKKCKEMLRDYADQYNPNLHNPMDDKNDYRGIRTEESILMGPYYDPSKTIFDDSSDPIIGLNNNTNTNPDQSLFESEDEYFTKKYPGLDSEDLPDVTIAGQESTINNNDNKIRVKDNSDKPVHTAFSKAYLENIKSRQRFYDMLLHNPIQNEEIDQRYAMLVDLDTRRRNMMTDDKSSHDLMQWIYILIERYEQSINSASSKSKVPGFISGKYRCTTREQITGKETFLLKEALNILNNRESLELIEAVISKNIFKPRVAEFHNERHDNLSESSFGISSFMG